MILNALPAEADKLARSLGFESADALLRGRSRPSNRIPPARPAGRGGGQDPQEWDMFAATLRAVKQVLQDTADPVPPVGWDPAKVAEGVRLAFKPYSESAAQRDQIHVTRDGRTVPAWVER